MYNSLVIHIAVINGTLHMNRTTIEANSSAVQLSWLCFF